MILERKCLKMIYN